MLSSRVAAAWRGRGLRVVRARVFGAVAFAVALAGLLRAGAGPADEVPDKSRYTLRNPTPDQLLREFSTDRPDKTETPFTVDAGHFQLEMDLFTYGRDQRNPEHMDTKVETWTAGPVNLKLGVLNRVDIQLVLEPFVSERAWDIPGPGPATRRRSGYGDTTLRSKVNFWGNDGGVTAMGVIPFLKLPTNQDDVGNDAVEGGFVFPLEIELGRGYSVGLNSGWGYARDEAGGGHHSEFVNTLAFGYPLGDRFSGYVEFWSLAGTEPGAEWEGSFDFGFNILIRPNLKLDLGLNTGVTRAAEDWNPFVGLSWRY